MPLISLTAAQRSTFLTHIPCPDPSSWAAPFYTNEEIQGQECRENMGSEMAIYIQLIFRFICMFWRLGRSGLREGGSVRRSACRVFYQAAAWMHDRRHADVGESMQQKVPSKVLWAPCQRSLRQMLSTDAERNSGTLSRVDQWYSARGHWSELWHFAPL